MISASLDGWKINRINIGPPYHVQLVGPYCLPQVEDSRGAGALSGPNGEVFCASVKQAQDLCDMANDGGLERI